MVAAALAASAISAAAQSGEAGRWSWTKLADPHLGVVAMSASVNTMTMEKTGKEMPVMLSVHCVGDSLFAMLLLAGRVHRDGTLLARRPFIRVDDNEAHQVSWKGSPLAMRLTQDLVSELRAGARLRVELPPPRDKGLLVVGFNLDGFDQALTAMAPYCEKVPWLTIP